MEEQHEDGLFSNLDMDRRKFVKRVAAVTAFAAPMIASYDLENLAPSSAGAQVSNSTQTITVLNHSQ